MRLYFLILAILLIRLEAFGQEAGNVGLLPSKPGEYSDPRSGPPVAHCDDKSENGIKSTFEKSEAAFLGKVTSVKAVPERKIFLVTFQVKKSWKGALGRSVEVEFAPRSDPNSEIGLMHPGAQFLMFPYGSPLFQHACTVMSGAGLSPEDASIKRFGDFVLGNADHLFDSSQNHR